MSLNSRKELSASLRVLQAASDELLQGQMQEHLLHVLKLG